MMQVVSRSLRGQAVSPAELRRSAIRSPRVSGILRRVRERA